MRQRGIGVSATRLSAALFGALAIVGCGPTVAERRISSINSDIPAAMQFQQACRAAVFARPEYADHARLMPLFADQASPMQLTVATRVRPDQRSSLGAMFASLSDCRRGTAARIEGALPEAAELMRQAEDAGERYQWALLNGEITWGEANTEAQRLAGNFRTGSGGLVSGTMSSLQAAHAEEVQRRGEAVMGAVVLVAAEVALAAASGGGRYRNPNLARVRPHRRRDGAYVPAHVRTAPDASLSNNRGPRR